MKLYYNNKKQPLNALKRKIVIKFGNENNIELEKMLNLSKELHEYAEINGINEIMKKIILRSILFCLFLLYFGSFIKAQNLKEATLEQFILGTSLTYIFDKQFQISDLHRYHEWTWSFNASTRLYKGLFAGINYMNIYSYGTDVERDRFHIVGLFTQYDFLKNKERLFIETGLYLGNYCTCGRFDPYKQSYLYYWSLGEGWELPIHRYFNLELAFINHLILTDVERKYNFTQYIVGVNFKL